MWDCDMETTSLVRNRYWVLRHGMSVSNERGLIVSSMENGRRAEFQLVAEGVKQAKLAGELFLKALMENNIPLENVRICYSPFSRTTHTAKVIASRLNLPFDGPQCKCFAWALLMVELAAARGRSLDFAGQAMEDLKERFLGPSLELKSHDEHPEIRALDAIATDPFMGPEGGESIDDVASRVTNAMTAMESEFQGCAVLIVSHGGPLQVLQSILNAVKQHPASSSDGDLASKLQVVRVPSILSQHRKFALLMGELRPLI
ncbi:hypothetical protein CJ030_MR7G024819 [Morella rubra]|uniref:Metal-independent phosphoserine phosphatase n=1 Tax=Morella rubra TaxID=262757 RepID=A0A6A1V9H8_9ROSI|nr:hypothetical protein CJ030_MR7G024819 [Morella rubra]